MLHINGLAHLCAVAIALLGARLVEAQDGVLPRELASVAREQGCGPVVDFYSRPGMVQPPFVYGYERGEVESSAVFWCQRAASDSIRLVVWRADSAATSVAWWNFPGGLSLTEPRNWSLSEFREVEAPTVRGPAVTIRAQRAIQSYYDGVSEFFILHNGKWYVLMID